MANQLYIVSYPHEAFFDPFFSCYDTPDFCLHVPLFSRVSIGPLERRNMEGRAVPHARVWDSDSFTF